jgi:hypothetical protein
MYTIEFIRELETKYDSNELPAEYLKSQADMKEYADYLYKEYGSFTMPAWCFNS